MDNNRFLTLLIGVMIAGLILASCVPIFNDLKTSMGTAQMNTTENYNAVYTESLSSDVVMELGSDNQLLVNGEEVNPALDLTETVLVTNEFVITYSGTELTFLGLSGGTLSKITVHPNGTYDVIKTDDTTSSGTGVEVIIYPDNNGKYGAFVQGIGHEPFWLDNDATCYLSFLSGGVTDNDNVDHYVNCLYSATNDTIETQWRTIYSLEDPSDSWVELPSVLTVNEPYTKEVGDLAVKWSTNNYTATFTNDSGDFDKTIGSPIVYAPLEYHILTENNSVTYTIVSLIPLIAGVGLLMFAVAYFLNRY